MADADLLFMYRKIMLWTLVRRTRRLARGKAMVLRNLVAVIGRGLVELEARRRLDHDEMSVVLSICHITPRLGRNGISK